MLNLIFILVLFLSIWSGYALVQYFKFILGIKQVIGIIQEVVYDEGFDCQFSASFVYEYEVGGKIYSSPVIQIGRGQRGSNNLVNLSELHNKYSEGNEVKVVYNRKKHEMSEVLDSLFFLKAVMIPFVFITFVYIDARLFSTLFL
ncbi:MAG: hypothetical protein Q9M50_10795 [Methylococcales bacterium]|nr:hypothetical protein [Methylococcales bacterium]